jgi:hypothetical protein
MTHLRRSSTDDADYSSGGTRQNKRIETFLGVGRKITEPLPEVLQGAVAIRLSWWRALWNLGSLVVKRLIV